MTKLNALIMLDVESLDLGPNSVLTQMAFLAVDRDDPETVIKSDDVYLPIQPQINTFNRTISAQTLIWWLTDPSINDSARAKFSRNSGEDMDEFLALVRSFANKMTQVITEAESYEVWAKGPQFDVVNISTLFSACGQEIPWHYAKVNDLRTLMNQAGLKKGDVPMPAGQVPHVAISDCRLQVAEYIEASRRLRASA